MSKSKVTFSRKDYDDLKLAQREIHDWHATADKAEKCGIDCTELRAVVADMLAKLQAIEREFFQNVPTS